jgi:hypothetical protein
MRQADLYTGASKLRDALKHLRAHWQQTEPYWRDSVRQHFEETFIDVVEPQTRGVIEAAGHLAEVLARAQHECS